MKEYDSSGRQKLATDWAAITSIPALVSQLGQTADPGNGTWVVEYNGTTDTFTFTASGSFSIAASQVSYTSTGSQWTATDVQAALHALEAEVDVLENSIGSAVQQTSGNFAVGLSGYGSTPTGTLYWVKTGNKVAMYCRADISGTSNSNAFALNAAIASGLRPAHTKVVPAMQFYDSGVLVPGAVQIDSAGVVTFLRTYLSGGTTVQTDAVWSNSGTKGLVAGCQWMYDLD